MALRKLVRSSLIAATYISLTLMFAPFSYGPIQVRISEALTVLPFLWVDAIPGLFVGCLIANILGGLGLVDIVFGSLATLGAAIVTSRMPNLWLAPLPPVIINALVVGTYLSVLFQIPVVAAIGYVGAGQAVSAYVLGIPLLLASRKLS